MYVLLACYQWGSQHWRLLANRGTPSLAPSKSVPRDSSFLSHIIISRVQIYNDNICILGSQQGNHKCTRHIFLFIYLGFYVTFNTVQVISRRVVGRAEETST